MTDPKPIGFWVKLVDQLIDGMFASTIEEHGVTRRQWQILSILSHGPATAAELDAELEPFVEESSEESAEDHVAELVESEWVSEDAEGRLALAERGRTAFDRLSEVIDQARASVAEGIEPDEYATTIAVLERMARNLGWRGQD